LFYNYAGILQVFYQNLVFNHKVGKIYDSGDIATGNSVVAKFATTAADGKVYLMEHFNLDIFILRSSVKIFDKLNKLL